VQLILATDRPSLCDSLCLYFSTRGVEVVATADSLPSLLAQALRVRPDVVVLDTELAGSFLEMTLDALGAAEDPPAVVLLNRRNAPEHPASTRAHACGTIGDPPEVLLRMIEDVSR
jgi:DNA-binding NarL/FixJ family response regulator